MDDSIANDRDKLLAMLKRWLAWYRSESVDCAIVHDTAKLVKAVEETRG